jgi:hypothetical protein
MGIGDEPVIVVEMDAEIFRTLRAAEPHHRLDGVVISLLDYLKLESLPVVKVLDFQLARSN